MGRSANAYWSGLTLVSLAIGSSGCGNLSKPEAEAQIRKRSFDSEAKTTLYCEWERHVRPGHGDTWVPVGDPLAVPPKGGDVCVKALVSVGALRDGSDVIGLRPGPKGKIVDRSLMFACGTNALGSILSIATEGKKATVRWTRETKVDRAVLSAVEACGLRAVPADASAEFSSTLSKDDDGRWSVVSD